LHTFLHGINKINGKIEPYTLVERIGRNRFNRALYVHAMLFRAIVIGRKIDTLKDEGRFLYI